jgi:hypothetical protein
VGEVRSQKSGVSAASGLAGDAPVGEVGSVAIAKREELTADRLIKSSG